LLQFGVEQKKSRGTVGMSELSPAEIFQREAERLHSMADSFTYYAVRDAFLEIASQYETLALRAASAAAPASDAAD